jgi:hypothetical protein
MLSGSVCVAQGVFVDGHDVLLLVPALPVVCSLRHKEVIYFIVDLWPMGCAISPSLMNSLFTSRDCKLVRLHFTIIDRGGVGSNYLMSVLLDEGLMSYVDSSMFST